jgi:hypothetical protein
MSQITKLVAFFPIFLAADIRGSLDLLIFALISCDGKILVELLKVMDDVVGALVRALDDDAAQVRLDACRVLEIMVAKIPGAACVMHKSKVTRKLRIVLDDSKRAVRREAACARCAWLRVQAN